MSVADVSAFATSQLALLAAEQEAEVEETRLLTSTYAPAVLARAGLAIVNLQVQSQRTGLGGKTVLELGLDPALSNGPSKDLPQHAMRVGDIVSVAEQPKGAERKKDRAELEKHAASGVVVRVMREMIVVALDREEVDSPSGRLWLVKLANDKTFKRMSITMKALGGSPDADKSILTRVILGQSTPTWVSAADLQIPVEWQDPSLNDSQKDAIHFALSSKEVALIHGPPGTGKTHTLIELILQLVRQKKRLLVCGPSNISVDNIVERLAPHKIPIVRLGHPARLLPGVLNHSLEVLTRTSDAAELVDDIRKELDQKQASIRKTRNGREKRTIYGEMKDLRKEYRERETNCIASLLRESKVVLATLHGSGGYQLKGQKFDVVIVDEASQALEASTWIPLLGYSASKLILAGDHLQLPPTVKSANSKIAGKPTNGKLNDESRSSRLDRTMFDRLLDMHGSTIKRMLTTQYRMHEKIMRFPSDNLYEGRLVAADAVKARLLTDLPYGVTESDDTLEPLVFYDTQGGDFPELVDDGEPTSRGNLLGDSKSNYAEATLVQNHLRSLIQNGVRVEDIAVISPYNGQVALLSQMLKSAFPQLELGSVDGFQGREKEAVIVSLVRSNAEGDVGFLAEKRRLNVAMTRPKRQLCVIADSETIKRGGNFLKAWMAHLEEHADLRYPEMAISSQDY